MKSHTVKSNAKRAARQIAAAAPDSWEVLEPVKAPDGNWYPALRALKPGLSHDLAVVTTAAELIEDAPVAGNGEAVQMPTVDAVTGEPVPPAVYAGDPDIEVVMALDVAGVGPVVVDASNTTMHITSRGRRTLDALRALPPRVVSTPEEIRARLDERRRNPRKPRVDAAAKAQAVRDLLARPGGALTSEFCAATGWSHHSVRRFMSQAGIKGTREGKESRYQA